MNQKQLAWMDANDSSCFLLENILLLKIRKISQNSWKIFQQLQAKLKHGPANEIKHIMLKQQKGLVRWPCSSLLALAGEMLIWHIFTLSKWIGWQISIIIRELHQVLLLNLWKVFLEIFHFVILCEKTGVQ